MTPVLNPNTDAERDIILVYRTNHPERGSICVFIDPTEASRQLVKQVAGIEGDYTTFRGKTIQIQQGRIWVQSEDRFRGVDSKSLGPIPKGLVVGQAVAIIWPPSRISFL